MYRLVRVMHDRGELHSPWVAHIEVILNQYGMGNVWNSPNNVDSNWFSKAFKLRASDIFKQNWHTMVSEMSSCLNYRLFKKEHILFAASLVNIKYNNRSTFFQNIFVTRVNS